MKISAIIPVYNEEKSILQCLNSLDSQTLKHFEVLVVDDGSTDKTSEKIANFVPKNYKLIQLTQDHKGPGAARNLGASKASGRVLVFVDSDMYFSTDFLKKLTSPILKNQEKGTFPENEIVGNYANKWSKNWNRNENINNDSRHKETGRVEDSVFRAILRSEFERVGGFDKGGYTDDYSLSKKLGYCAQVASGATLYHDNPDSLKEVFIQSRWAAKRDYKLGLLGVFIQYLRLILGIPVIGLLKSVKFKDPSFFIFKLVYNAGSILGLLEFMLTNKTQK